MKLPFLPCSARFLLGPLCVWSLAAVPAQADVVTVPFFENFDSFTPANAASDETAFDESNPSAFDVVNQSGTDDAYRGRIAASTAGHALLQAQGFAGMDFVIQSDGTLTERNITGTAAASVMSFSLNAAATSVTSSTSNGYNLTVNLLNGEVTLRKGASTLLTSPTDTVSFSIGTYYTLSLSADYTTPTAAALSLEVTSTNATDGLRTYAPAVIQDNSALSGDFFGYRVAKNGTGTVIAVQFDNFSLVPEPSSALLLAGGVAGMLGLRRRRA